MCKLTILILVQFIYFLLYKTFVVVKTHGLIPQIFICNSFHTVCITVDLFNIQYLISVRRCVVYFESPGRITSFPLVCLDAWSCARLSQPAAARCPFFSERKAPSQRHVSEQPEKSPTRETFGFAPQLIRQVHPRAFINLLRGRSSWKSPRPIYKLERHKRLQDATAERTSALKFAAFPSLLSLLRLCRRKISRFYKTLLGRNIVDNGTVMKI